MTRILNNNKLLGHIFFLILGIFAVVFYLERTTFVDPAWVVFKLILEKTFQQEVGRYAAVIPQLLPLAGIWAGMPLKAILLLYSLSFIVLYYIIFLIISYILKNDAIALALPLALVLGVSDSFFWISTETHQTIAYNLLFIAFLYYSKNFPPGFLQDLKKYLLAAFLLLLCFFTHPVSLFTVLFILGYFAIDTHAWRNPFVYVMASLVIALAFLKLLIVPEGGYESGFFKSFLAIFDNIRLLRESFSLRFIMDHVSLYIYPAIIAVITCIFYIVQKKYVHLVYLIISSSLFLLIVFTTFNNYFDAHIQEKNIMPLNLFLLIPFFKDVTFRSAKAGMAKQAVVIIVFIISLIHVSMAGTSYAKRIGHINDLIEKVKALPEKKFVVSENLLNPDHFKVFWGMPFETLLLSALEHPDSARTIYVLYDHEVLGTSVDLKNPNLLLTIQGYPFFLYKEHLDTNYFKLGNSVYRVLEESDIASSDDTRIILLNHFSDGLFTESGDSCHSDSTGNDYFLLTHEFGPGMITTYSALTARSSVWIRASVLADPQDTIEPRSLSLVITREKDGMMLDYFTSYYDGIPPLTPGTWNSMEAGGVFLQAHPDDVVKVYIWNPGKNKVRIDDLKVSVSKE